MCCRHCRSSPSPSGAELSLGSPDRGSGGAGPRSARPVGVGAPGAGQPAAYRGPTTALRLPPSVRTGGGQTGLGLRKKSFSLELYRGFLPSQERRQAYGAGCGVTITPAKPVLGSGQCLLLVLLQPGRYLLRWILTCTLCVFLQCSSLSMLNLYGTRSAVYVLRERS